MKARKTAQVSANSYLIPYAALSLLCALAYINSLDVPFVLDDQVTIQRNAGVRFGEYLSGSLLWTRSILYLTFALNHWIAGLDVWGYHLVNVGLHILNGILVFHIGRHIFRKLDVPESDRQWMALIAAAVFLVHPVQTESVTYVSSRSELLSTFFYALAFLIFIRWPELKIGFLLAGVMVLLFLLGMGSKETVITLPIALLLYDWIFIARGSLRLLLTRWRFYSVFLGLGIAASIYLVQQWRTFFQSDPAVLPPWTYFLTQLRVIPHYVRIMIFPAGLNLDYDFPVSRSLFTPMVMVSLFAILTLIAAGLYWRRSAPLYSLSILWFFITLAPTSSIIPIQDVIFEHRLYLPLLVVSLSFPYAVRTLSQARFRWLNGRYFCWGVVAILLGITVMRNEVWRDPVRLWTDVVSKSPAKLRGYSFLTSAYAAKGDYENAITTLRTAESRVRDDERWEVRNTLGTLYLRTGQYDQAIETFNQALEGSKDPSMTYNNLGMAYLQVWSGVQQKRNQITEQEFTTAKTNLLRAASQAFLESHHRDRNNLWPLDSYINVMFDAGSIDSLKAEFQAKLSQKSDFDTLYSLGKISWLEGAYEEAAKLFDRAIRVRSDQKLLYFNNAFALEKLGRLDDAILSYLNAIRIDPLFKEAHHNVALLYVKANDLDRAAEHFGEVLRVDPEYIPSFIGMAKISIRRGETTRARYYLQEALRRNPQHGEAAALLQTVGG